MLILFLCRKSDLAREALGYARAFERRGVRLTYVEDSFPCNGDLGALLARCDEKPVLVLQPETRFSFFPRGLTETDIPTACCHYDVYAYTHRRVRWAMLFDYAFLFHPGFEEPFRSAGHPHPITLPHAVDREYFSENAALKRSIDVAWAGRVDGPLYGRRRRILPILAASFNMNDWHQSYPYAELAKLYSQSKIVVNVGRDDYPVDTSLRFAEAMAAGALFITPFPSELQLLGFERNRHYVGFADEKELINVIRHYLQNEDERRGIAEAAQEVVLQKHTYDRRVDEILRILGRDEGRLFAPARNWPEDRVRQVYLDYYCANNLLDCAFEEFRRLAVSRPAAACKSLPPILGALRRGWKSRTAIS